MDLGLIKAFFIVGSDHENNRQLPTQNIHYCPSLENMAVADRLIVFVLLIYQLMGFAIYFLIVFRMFYIGCQTILHYLLNINKQLWTETF